MALLLSEETNFNINLYAITKNNLQVSYGIDNNYSKCSNASFSFCRALSSNYSSPLSRIVKERLSRKILCRENKSFSLVGIIKLKSKRAQIGRPWFIQQELISVSITLAEIVLTLKMEEYQNKKQIGLNVSVVSKGFIRRQFFYAFLYGAFTTLYFGNAVGTETETK